MHHEGSGPRLCRGFGEATGLPQPPAHPCKQRRTSVDQFRDLMDHGAGLVGRQGVEFTCIAVHYRHVNARVEGTVDDWCQFAGRDVVLAVVGRHEDPRNTGQCIVEIKCHGASCQKMSGSPAASPWSRVR